jgi:thioredoxin-like negative regulator of GroEL
MTQAPPEPANTGEKQDRRFEKGQSGNPSGRPAGSRNKATILLDRLAEDEAEAIQRQVIEAAKEGDLKAAELILARIWPPRRGRPVRLDLPAVRTAAEVSDGMASVVDAMAAGEVTPEEAVTVSGVLEFRRKALETEELASRIERLEQGRKLR